MDIVGASQPGASAPGTTSSDVRRAFWVTKGTVNMRNLERNRRSLGRTSCLGVAMTALALVHSAPALAQEEAATTGVSEAEAGDQIIAKDIEKRLASRR